MINIPDLEEAVEYHTETKMGFHADGTKASYDWAIIEAARRYLAMRKQIGVVDE